MYPQSQQTTDVRMLQQGCCGSVCIRSRTQNYSFARIVIGVEQCWHCHTQHKTPPLRITIAQSVCLPLSPCLQQVCAWVLLLLPPVPPLSGPTYSRRSFCLSWYCLYDTFSLSA